MGGPKPAKEVARKGLKPAKEVARKGQPAKEVVRKGQKPTKKLARKGQLKPAGLKIEDLMGHARDRPTNDPLKSRAKGSKTKDIGPRTRLDDDETKDPISDEAVHLDGL